MARSLRRLVLLALLGASVAAAVRALRGRGQFGAPGGLSAPDAGPAWPPTQRAGEPGADASPASSPAGDTATVVAEAELVQTAWVDPVAGACPDGYPVKATSSGIYHVPGGQFYERTAAERCYSDAETAEADGYRAARR